MLKQVNPNPLKEYFLESTDTDVQAVVAADPNSLAPRVLRNITITNNDGSDIDVNLSKRRNGVVRDILNSKTVATQDSLVVAQEGQIFQLEPGWELIFEPSASGTMHVHVLVEDAT